MKITQFIKESLINLRQVGTIIPSSKSIVKKMIEPINFEKDITIIEIGAGTGVITKTILDKMSNKSKLICFETNNLFNKELKIINDSRIEIICDSAENINDYLETYGINKIDYIVSSVPILMLPEVVTDKILLVCSRLLANNGEFIQLQYSKFLDKKIKKYFKHINISLTLKYYLPGFIYVCHNKKNL